MRRYIFLTLIILLLIITYSTTFFIEKKRSFNENLLLKQENQELRAQIQKIQIPVCGIQPPGDNYLSAKVFSTYPFNIKNQIVIDIGENKGIKKMMAATVGENILVGQVIEVYKTSSVIKTFFDPNWQLPVRIGKEETNGLLEGGSEPKVILIEKEKPLQVNDIVYSASQEFSYGLKIGEITEIRESAAGVFKEAVLKMPFNVSELREVNVLLRNTK